MGRAADVILDGGTLHIEWMPDNHVQMTGPAAISFSGTLDPSLLDAPVDTPLNTPLNTEEGA